ncbi:uncharacterized protein LOC133446188 [Cololabis saira]|uniref:uncharacterized protein LOC133446188 n=1 Tax=Cololabis saira TaxID=129043 RepID=UPI002AD54428|nr:uncharacterized protein LOC133446188 [Cololabis saira]
MMSKMSFWSFNIFIIFTFEFICHLSHGLTVNQTAFKIVNRDRSVSIECAYDEPDELLLDVRLTRLTESSKEMLCQKEKKDCKNVFMHKERPREYRFILLNLSEKEMRHTYECEVTVRKNDLHDTKTGAGTRLRPASWESSTETVDRTTPSQGHEANRTEPGGTCAPSHPPEIQLLSWILIGLLALTFLYSCVISCCYIRHLTCNNDCENSTYVEMRKAPTKWSPGVNMG